MIQRIQTIFLILAILINLATLFVPVWQYTGGETTEFVNGMGVAEVQGEQMLSQVSFTSNVIHIVFFGLCVAVSAFIAFVIFQYGDRMKQMKMAYAAVVGVFIEIAAIVLLTMQGPFILGASQDGGNPVFGFAFPVVAAILIWIAAKRIKKDEDLVRSVDRIR